MNVRKFPWVPVLAGFGSGVAGFAAAALASGVIHLGSADSCRSADHQLGATTAQAHAPASPTACPCCCEGHRAVTAAEEDGSSLQLTVIEPTATSRAGCEDDTWLGSPAAVAAVRLTSDQLAAGEGVDLARPVWPLTAIIEPTAARADDPTTVPSLNPGRPTGPAADRGWTGLASPIVAPNGIAAALAGGSAGGFPGGGSARSARALAPIESAAASTDFGLAPSRLAAWPWNELARLATPTAGHPVAEIDWTGPAPASYLANLVAATATAEGSVAGTTLALGAAPTATFASLPASSPTAPPTDPVTSVAVPEPSSLILASVAIGLVGLARRRRWTQSS